MELSHEVYGDATERIAARFNAKWKLDEATGCRLWIGSISERGYGKVMINGACVRAHRCAWMLVHGPIPEGMCVCHGCDVLHETRWTSRRCVNVDHLFLGTAADNTADMMAKGRYVAPSGNHVDPVKRARGMRAGRAKITDDQVREIRAARDSGEIARSIAGRFGISVTNVFSIARRDTWTHVP